DRFFVTLPLGCRIAYSHCGREAELDGESMYLVAASRPVEVVYPRLHRVINLSVPGAALRRRLGVPEDYCGRRCPTDAGAGLLATSMTVSLSEPPQEIAPAQLAEFGERVLDVVGLALAALGAPADSPARASPSVRWAHLMRAQRLIDARLAEPGL